jgi:hypothetical protein
MTYDALLFSAHQGNAGYATLLALGVDAISLIIAIVFIIRLEDIQGIAVDEGDKVGLQAELLKRHRPTSASGMYEVITHFGFGGLIIVLLTMSLSSLMIYHLSLLFIKANPKYLLSAVFFGFIALQCWLKTLKIALTIHEETEDELDEDLRDALMDGALDD